MKFIIIGAGDVGVTLSKKLVMEQHDVTLVERYEHHVSKAAAGLDIELVYGNGCAPDVLARAGIHTADYLIAVADHDEVNISACLVARLLNPETRRIARIRDINLMHKDISPARLGEYFDFIINPDQAAANYLLQLFQVAGAKEVIDFCNGKLRVLGISLSDMSPLLNRRLRDVVEIREKLSVLVIGIVRNNRLYVPTGDDIFEPGDIIYCITPPENTSRLFEYAGRNHIQSKSAVIWGGNPLGKAVAHALEAEGTKIKLIVSEEESSHELLDDFKEVLILQGDGKDGNLLVEENIADVDAFIAVTADDEDNILAALHARKLGAKSSMAHVNKGTYLALVHAIGVDVVVSSRIAAASAIFTHIHSDSMVSRFSLRHLGAGFLEYRVKKDTPIVGRTLSELQIPRGILFAAIVRGEEFIIPGGRDMVFEDDIIIIFVTDKQQKKLEKILKTKLELFV